MGFGDRYSEYEKPAAYAPLLLQRALVLGACSQEAEGRAGKASSSDSTIRKQTSCTRHLPLPSLLLSYGSQCHQRAALHKHLSFAQKLPAYAPPSGATRTSIGGLQSRSGRKGLESELSRLGHSYGRRHARATCRCVPAPFVWKPVSPTSSTGQESAFRSIRPPSGATRTSIGGLQSRSGRTGRESTLSRLDHS